MEPKPAPFTLADQRAVKPVLAQFIRSAVSREDVPRSWDLSAPNLKEGLTRKQWNRGQLPVVPYPAADRGLGTWSFVEYSYKGTVALEVFLFPKPRSGYSALTAEVELVKANDGRWLVDYWMPKRFHGPPSLAVQKSKKAITGKSAGKKHKPPPRAAAPYVPPQGRLKGLWWAVPLGLLSLIIVVPVLIALGLWYQNRRAQREYLRSQSER